MIEAVFPSVSALVIAITWLKFDWLLSSAAMHASNGNLAPFILYGIVAGGAAIISIGSAYVYENFIDSDPVSVNYNIEAPESLNGGTFTPTVFTGGVDSGSGGGLTAGGLGTGALIGLAAGAYFLLKD